MWCDSAVAAPEIKMSDVFFSSLEDEVILAQKSCSQQAFKNDLIFPPWANALEND